jgi:hypothetical protein
MGCRKAVKTLVLYCCDLSVDESKGKMQQIWHPIYLKTTMGRGPTVGIDLLA